jgi:NosR/NirI family nitrous oxide reductase transcriptional regulator
MRLARLALGACLLALSASAAAQATSYEAPLPPQLASDPDMCAYAPCREVLPGAESFSHRTGRPPYVEGYRAEGGAQKLVGYVFLSTDVVDIPAYSGKPMVTLIGMDSRGVITGVKILKHSEPILLVGIPESKLGDFVRQYLGKFVGDKIEIGKARAGAGYVGVDAISGATVTVIAENQVILRSGYAIARQVGLIKAVPRPPAVFTPVSEILDWDALAKEGSIARLSVRPKDVGAEDTGEPYIELDFGYLNAPTIGRSILGDEGYRRLMDDLKPGEHAIFIIGRGATSFKGSGFVRGGIYDRIQVAQEADTLTFRDTDYLNLYGVRAKGAPAYKESGIFILRGGSFSAAYPWSLVFLANTRDKQTGAATFANFDREYWLPARYLEGGRPAIARPEPSWLRVWKDRKLEIAAFVLFLAAVATVYALHDRLVRRATRKNKRWVTIPRYAAWIVSVGFIGFYATAQPSITHVLTWFHSLVYKWRWELFLSDPLIFIFWWFIIVTVFLWGRGLFCGWLCPYGSLTELAFKLGGALGLKRFQFNLPLVWHDRLKWLKYGVFTILLAMSFYSIGAAERTAEVEPFKTTFLVGVWNRTWPFAAYWAALFALSMFMERPFCKYLCPLGAGLAVPTTFRFFGLKRKAECASCHACQKGCGSLAIDNLGRIDRRECLLCLECQILYYDDHSCPPLSRERRRRARAGLGLTPVGADGYFIPIRELRPAAEVQPAVQDRA